MQHFSLQEHVRVNTHDRGGGQVEIRLCRLQYLEAYGIRSGFAEFSNNLPEQIGIKLITSPVSFRQNALNVSLFLDGETSEFTSNAAYFLTNFTSESYSLGIKLSSKLNLTFQETFLPLKKTGLSGISVWSPLLNWRQHVRILRLFMNYTISVPGTMQFQHLSTDPRTGAVLLKVLLVFDDALSSLNSISQFDTKNCVVSRLVMINMRQYELFLAPQVGDAYVSVELKAGVASARHNPTVPNAPVACRFFYAVSAPRVSITSSVLERSPLEVVSENSIPVTVMFSVPVKPFGPDVFQTDATISNFRSRKGSKVEYLLDMTPQTVGVSSLLLSEGAVETATGVPSNYSNILRVNFRPRQVLVHISAEIEAQTFARLVQVAMLFSEGVKFLKVEDLVLQNGKVVEGSLRSDGLRKYTFDVTPKNTGLVTVDLPAEVASAVEDGSKTNAPASVSFYFDPCLQCHSEAQCHEMDSSSDDGDGETSVECECQPGYTGDATLQCIQCPGGSQNPCSNHGDCIATSNLENICQCDEGWSGSACSINLDVSRPGGVGCQIVDFSSIRVSWSTNASGLVSHRVRVFPIDLKVDVPPTATNYDILGLTPGLKYDVSVSAVRVLWWLLRLAWC
jgi:hypothetical protein